MKTRVYNILASVAFYIGAPIVAVWFILSFRAWAENAPAATTGAITAQEAADAGWNWLATWFVLFVAFVVWCGFRAWINGPSNEQTTGVTTHYRPNYDGAGDTIAREAEKVRN